MDKKRGDAAEFLKEFFPETPTPGAVIRACRKGSNITLKEVSDLTGIDVTNLSAIENDRKQIGAKAAVKIAFALGLHPSSILFPDGFETSDSELLELKQKADKFMDKKNSENQKAS